VTELAIAEGLVKQLEDARLSELRRIIGVGRNIQMALYRTDDSALSGVIEIKHDAPFVVESIMIAGGSIPQDTGPITTMLLQIENVGIVYVTDGMTPPVAAPTAPVVPTRLQSIAVDAFTPGYRRPEGVYVSPFADIAMPPQIDYQYVLPAEWVLPIGTTIRCRFTDRTGTYGTVATVPSVILFGYKVFP
jgi:hypothetical protein